MLIFTQVKCVLLKQNCFQPVKKLSEDAGTRALQKWAIHQGMTILFRNEETPRCQQFASVHDDVTCSYVQQCTFRVLQQRCIGIRPRLVHLSGFRMKVHWIRGLAGAPFGFLHEGALDSSKFVAFPRDLPCMHPNYWHPSTQPSIEALLVCRRSSPQQS